MIAAMSSVVVTICKKAILLLGEHIYISVLQTKNRSVRISRLVVTASQVFRLEPHPHFSTIHVTSVREFFTTLKMELVCSEF